MPLPFAKTLPVWAASVLSLSLVAPASAGSDVVMFDNAPSASAILRVLDGGSAPAAAPRGAVPDYLLNEDDFASQSLVDSVSGGDIVQGEGKRYASAESAAAVASDALPQGKPSPAASVGLNIAFDANSAAITPGYFEAVDALASALRERPEMHILITGHADSSGAAGYNTVLSRKRAESVRHALRRRGADAERIAVLGYGSALALPGLSADDPRNRRIQVWNLSALTGE